MDRALDDIVNEGRTRDNRRGGGRRERRAPPRDGVRKQSQRREPMDMKSDWVHDRFQDDHDRRDRRPQRGDYRSASNSPPPPRADSTQSGAKLRIDNLHWDLTEEDLEGLFSSRIGPVLSVEILFDRKFNRSRGIAFVVMKYEQDADDAIREFDGADAKGQPIRVSRAPSARPARNPFDFAERPSKSLFDRIQTPRSTSPTDDENPRSRRNGRNPRPDIARGSTPEGVDRYVPGRSGRGAPPPRRNNDGPRRGPRSAPGQQKERERTDRRRPKKTQQELDEEMAEYFGGDTAQATELNGNGTVPSAPVAAGGDIDMIE